MHEIISTVGLEQVSDDIPIARYVNSKKLKTLLEKQEIWYSDVKKLYDKRERNIPDSFFKGWSKESKQGYMTINNAKNAAVWAYVSCWTKFNSENYALWKIYNSDNMGACLVSTVGKLKKAINRNDMFICEVEYIPLKGDKKIELPWVFYESGSVPHCMRVIEKYKILPYKYEDEIRSIIYSRRKNKGIALKVNLKEMVDEIYVSPFSNERKLN